MLPQPQNFLEIHPIEFARQLTLLEFDVFRCITPFELYNQVFGCSSFLQQISIFDIQMVSRF
jgi:hypothetical protein